MIPFFLILYLKLEDIYSRLLNLQVFFEKILGTRDFGEQETVFLSTSCQLIDFLKLYSYFILGKALLLQDCYRTWKSGKSRNVRE